MLALLKSFFWCTCLNFIVGGAVDDASIDVCATSSSESCSGEDKHWSMLQARSTKVRAFKPATESSSLEVSFLDQVKHTGPGANYDAADDMWQGMWTTPDPFANPNMTNWRTENVNNNGTKYYLSAHHKSGFMLATQAFSSMRTALQNLANEGAANHSAVDTHLAFHPVLAVAGDSSEIMTMMPSNNSCLLHLVRNPFEMVVSGYVYHLAGSEVWVNTSLFGETVANDAACTGGSKAFCNLNKGVANVFRESRAGPVSDWLPDAAPQEAYRNYLQRIDVDQGLVAEFIWAREQSLQPMLAGFDYVAKNTGCSMNKCLHDFYGQCTNVWQEVLKSWQIPEPDYSSMLHAAEAACPEVSQQAHEHSSTQQAVERNVIHPPEHELLNRLRVLDNQHLGGTIAQMERHMAQCQVSGKYLDPALK